MKALTPKAPQASLSNRGDRGDTQRGPRQVLTLCASLRSLRFEAGRLRRHRSSQQATVLALTAALGAAPVKERHPFRMGSIRWWDGR